MANLGVKLSNYKPAVSGMGLTRPGLIGNHLIRDDMTAKGQGFYGNTNGTPSTDAPETTELSIGVGVPESYQHIPGLNPAPAPLQLPGHQRYFDAPSIVPGMTPQQLSDVHNEQVNDSMYSAAEKAAMDRQWMGKPVFAKPTEPVIPYHIKRTTR